MLKLLQTFSPAYRDVAVVGIEIAIVVIAFFAALLFLKLLTRQVERSAKREAVRGLARTLRRNTNMLLVLVLMAGTIGIAAVNAYLGYSGLGIYRETSARLATIPPGFWMAVGIGIAKVAGLVVAAGIVIGVARRILAALQKRAKAWEQLRANDESIDAVFASLNPILKISVWLGVLALATRWLLFPPAVPAFLWIALRVYLVVAFGLLAVRAVAAIVDSMDALSAKLARGDRLLEIYQRMRGLIPLLRRCLEYAIYVFVATLVLMQMSFIAKFAEYGPRLIQVIGIFFIARVAVEICNLFVDKKHSGASELSELERQQQATLVPLIKSFLRSIVYFAALVLMLGALDLNPLPLLAGAGVLGLVIGFGAQPVISDILSGFFILSENHYLVGDFVEIGEARGKVESIQLRTTRIRDTDGQQHILRNGQINSVINFSKTYTFAVVEVGVSFDSNLDHVYDVLRETGKRLAAAHPAVTAPTEVAGLEQFGASELLIRTLTRVKPGTHQQVARDLRKMIHEAFRESNVEIPYPHQVNIRGDAVTGS